VTPEDRDVVKRFIAALDGNTAALRSVEGKVDDLTARISRLEERQTSVEKCVDGFDRYVRKAVKGDHADAEHAEREAEEAREALASLELERVADLENHERAVRRGGGE
jgi:hypothetical protein